MRFTIQGQWQSLAVLRGKEKPKSFADSIMPTKAGDLQLTFRPFNEDEAKRFMGVLPFLHSGKDTTVTVTRFRHALIVEAVQPGDLRLTSCLCGWQSEEEGFNWREWGAHWKDAMLRGEMP